MIMVKFLSGNWCHPLSLIIGMSILLLAAAVIVVCILQINYVTSFTTPRYRMTSTTSSSLHLYLPSIDDIHALTTSIPTTASSHVASAAASSILLSTIDSDIANIPDNEFRTVFAGGIGIMFGSILSTIFVGYLIESPGGGSGKRSGYVDLVAETYVEQSSIMGEKEETFLNSLGLVSVYYITTVLTFIMSMYNYFSHNIYIDCRTKG